MNQRRSKTAESSETRARLIDSAVRLIENGGPATATSRAIADGAGENLASITYYFGSKDSLVSEAMIGVVKSLIGPAVAVLSDPELGPVEKLQATVVALSGILQSNRGRISGYLVSLAAGTHNEAVRSQIVQLHSDLVSALAHSIEDQVKRGLVPAWTDPKAMAELMVALANGVTLRAALDPEGVDPAVVASQFTQLLVAAGSRPEPGAGKGLVQ